MLLLKFRSIACHFSAAGHEARGGELTAVVDFLLTIL
jgi:hypothetical protein